MRLAARITALLLTAAVGCGGSSTAPGTGNNNTQQSGGNTGGGGTAGSTNNSVTVGNNYFDPPSTTVSAGTQVTWTWNTCNGDGYGGQTCVSHGIAFDDGTTAPAQSEGSWQRTFATAGTYKYHCTVHGAAMAGAIVVQ